jgi:aerobic-type carbon monoxide dehydrogenase small subunit (CoxS/CutS family)
MAAQQSSAIIITVNGTGRELNLNPESTLLMALRQDLDLKGTRTGCLEGYCGACTVLVDGRPTQACNTLLSAVSGRNVETIEAANSSNALGVVQRAFLKEQAAQCGYCSNGIIVTVAGLLSQEAPASRQEIVAFLDERHLCRCGAQPRILRAIDRAIQSRERSR